MPVDVLERMAALRVLVIGDAMWDEYRFGECSRLAQEAPVPVFHETARERREGGAANVAAQLRELSHAVLIAPPDRCTKVRYIAGTHQLLRIDDDQVARPDWYDRLDVFSEVQRADVVVLSDYAKGALTEPLCRLVMDHAKLVVVDPKGSSWEKYRGAHVICPNGREYESWDRSWTPPVIIHKRGPLGLTIRMGDDERTVPACAQAVYDVTGAGDAVVAVFAAGFASGMGVTEAAALANRAAGWAVGQVGTTVVPRKRFAAWLK